MTKKIVDILTTTLLIIVAIFALINLVGCGTTTTKETEETHKVTEEEIVDKIEKNYNFPVNIDVWRHDGEVKGYYVTYEEEFEFTNYSGDKKVELMTIAEAYSPDGEFTEKAIGKNYREAMEYLNPIKP